MFSYLEIHILFLNYLCKLDTLKIIQKNPHSQHLVLRRIFLVPFAEYRPDTCGGSHHLIEGGNSKTNGGIIFTSLLDIYKPFFEIHV